MMNFHSTPFKSQKEGTKGLIISLEIVEYSLQQYHISALPHLFIDLPSNRQVLGFALCQIMMFILFFEPHS